MGEISEHVSEAVEKASEEGSKLNTFVAMAVAVAATFMAIGNVKAGNVDQAMGKTQIEIVDTWSYFQAKSTKESLAEGAADQLAIQRETATAEQRPVIEKQIADHKVKVARYEKEKSDLQAKAEGLEKQYEALNVKDDQFDMSEALLSVAIALFGITALTKKRWMIFVAGGFAAFGIAVGVAGFLGWSLRPEWLASLLGA